MRFASILSRRLNVMVVALLVCSCAGTTDNKRKGDARDSRHIQIDLVKGLPGTYRPSNMNIDEIVQTSVTVAGISRPGIYMQAPGALYQPVFLHPQSRFMSWITLAPTAWVGSTDGAEFILSVILPERAETVEIGRKRLDPRRFPDQRIWHEFSADLSFWAGSRVVLGLRVDPGPMADNTKDWCIWGQPEVSSPPLDSSSFDCAAVQQLVTRGVLKVDHDFYVTRDIAEEAASPGANQPFKTTSFSLGGETREGLYIHPPWTVSRAVVPGARAFLCASMGLIETCWNSSDGVLFQVTVHTLEGADRTLFEYFLSPATNTCDRHWIDFAVDLSDYAFEPITVTLSTTPGYADNFNCDSGAWIRPIIVSRS